MKLLFLSLEKVNLGVTVFVSMRTRQHSVPWLEKFRAAVPLSYAA